MSARCGCGVLIVSVVASASAMAGAASDTADCVPMGARVPASGADPARVSLDLRLRWRVPDSTATRATPSNAAATITTTTLALTGTASPEGERPAGSATVPARALPDEWALSTLNGHALAWSETRLHQEPTGQAVWTAQGQGWVGAERSVAVSDSAWFCPHWPGGASAVTVDYRLGSDPQPAGTESGMVPRGWRRSGRIQAPLGTWVRLSPGSGERFPGLALTTRELGHAEGATTGHRVATDDLAPSTPVLDMRWSLSAADAVSDPPRPPKAAPRPATSPGARR